MRVAAYQARLLPPGSVEEALEHIRARVAWCETDCVEILCCPEAILGGLADYAPRPAEIAIDVELGQLDALLAPLASDTVTTILGFTETASTGHFYNSAAVFHRGSVTGIYRKLHPAMRQSIAERTSVSLSEGNVHLFGTQGQAQRTAPTVVGVLAPALIGR